MTKDFNSFIINAWKQFYPVVRKLTNMVSDSHINQVVTYRGRALDFPKGITSVKMKLFAVGQSGDAWLQSGDGEQLFGVSAADCFPTYTAPFVVDPEFDSWAMEPVIQNPRRR